MTRQEYYTARRPHKSISACDDADRLTDEKWQASGGAQIYAFQWDCDAVGNRSYEDDDGTERYYTCDAANQLARVHQLPAVGTCLACDAKGNCLRLQESDGTIYLAYNERT